MHYHVCKFSNAVVKSYYTPVPHVDAGGYVEALKKAVKESHIDIVIPMHEEIFYICEARYSEQLQPSSVDKFDWSSFTLCAPPFPVLIMLHNKWEFSRFLKSIGLDTPAAILITSQEDVKKLVGNGTPGLLNSAFTKHGVALKPVYGRACSNVYHLKPEDPSNGLPEKLDVSPENHYIAQEWLVGNRYCSYSLVRSGKVLALGVYPVQDTIDGSSCVYFESVTHTGIAAYVEKLASALSDINVTFQIALDFVETPLPDPSNPKDTTPPRLVAIECNPRATSGIHLWSGSPDLAQIFASANSTTSPTTTIHPKPHTRRQLAPGMLMWSHENISPRQYLTHMKKLMGSKDVMFSKRDLSPSLMQPFLLTSYYEICRERKMELAEMFQWDFTWMLDVETDVGRDGKPKDAKRTEKSDLNEKEENQRREKALARINWVRGLVREEALRRGVIWEGADDGWSHGDGIPEKEGLHHNGNGGERDDAMMVKGGLQVMPGRGDEEVMKRDSGVGAR